MRQIVCDKYQRILTKFSKSIALGITFESDPVYIFIFLILDRKTAHFPQILDS